MVTGHHPQRMCTTCWPSCRRGRCVFAWFESQIEKSHNVTFSLREVLECRDWKGNRQKEAGRITTSSKIHISLIAGPRASLALKEWGGSLGCVCLYQREFATSGRLNSTFQTEDFSYCCEFPLCSRAQLKLTCRVCRGGDWETVWAAARLLGACVYSHFCCLFSLSRPTQGLRHFAKKTK